MIRFIQTDIMSLTYGVICHQVNTLGYMNSGLAKQIRAAHPNHFGYYCKYISDNKDVFGHAIITHHNDISVAALFGQETIGHEGKHTNYGALAMALRALYTLTGKEPEKPIYMPYFMGCGLGGGNWDIVLELIKFTFKHNRDLVICKYKPEL